MAENQSKKGGNLTNKDFRELLKTHMTSKRLEMPHLECVREPSKATIRQTEKKDKKAAKTKRYEERRREDPLGELLSRYRDRARERREGKNPDYSAVVGESRTVVEHQSSGYHAVAHHLSYSVKVTERRRQVIQESKYLGGDMAHTHLVKGLDFALLNKVRSEIEAKCKEGVEETPEEEETTFKTQLGRNIYEVLFGRPEELQNGLYGPGKMSYLVDLMEEDTDTDIPTTVIRSRTTVQESGGSSLITTDAIIEKIRRVMLGLKESGRGVKRMRRQEPLHEQPPERKQEVNKPETKKPSKTELMLKKLTAEPTGYAECYPGQEAAMEAASDSDTEAPPPRTGHHHPEEEIAPRAAYQFGLKKCCGRRTRQSERGSRATLDREWARIRDRLQL